MQKTYQGSCHCGAIKFEADIDLAQGTGKCNCSICTKSRYWGTAVKPEAFRLKSSDSNVGSYQFGSFSIQHHFCKTCGIKAFGRGDIPQLGGAFVSINVACLDDVDLTELIEAPVHYSDGRHNQWHLRPAETRHL